MKEPIYLSVVLSTYNDEKYIAESIQSILDQTYPYFEFIIVNDGSTDKTKEILEDYSKQNKLKWYTGENLKPANSFFFLLIHHKL